MYLSMYSMAEVSFHWSVKILPCSAPHHYHYRCCHILNGIRHMGLYRTSKFLSTPQAFNNFLTHVHFRNGEGWPRVVQTRSAEPIRHSDQYSLFVQRPGAKIFCKNTWFKAVGLFYTFYSFLFTSPVTWCKDQRILSHLESGLKGNES